jgi:hypothetical protein
MGYAPVQNFEAIRPRFESIASGFSPLRDPRIANVQPAHLRIVRADRPMPFASYVPTSLPPKMNAETVAIMNQVNVNEVVPAGAELKVPDGSMATSMPAAGEVLATVPQQNLPSSQYPTDNSYPQTSSYPPTNSYPPANYPPTSSPSSTYPSSSYPYPTNGYPQTQSQPQYPASTTTYPQSSYPPPQSTPNGYPSPEYPAQPNIYPPASYPSSNTYPQYPAQPAAPYTYPIAQYPNSYPTQPNWPRLE